MGELARTLVSLSGPSSVHGVIPNALIKREASETIDSALYGRTTSVDDMHTRKALMAKEVREGGLGSGFVALSGGFGTMEELMEMTTWNQLGIHEMAVVVFNVEGYWDGLMAWIGKAVEAGFIAGNNAGIVQEARAAEGVVEALRGYRLAEGRFKLDWEEK